MVATWTVVVPGEDHTLGNLLSERIMDSARAQAVSCRVAHPLSKELELCIAADSVQMARSVAADACAALEATLDALLSDVGCDDPAAGPRFGLTAPVGEVRHEEPAAAA